MNRKKKDNNKFSGHVHLNPACQWPFPKVDQPNQTNTTEESTVSKDRFDLEQEIMACWGVTSDLDILMEGVLEKDMSQDDIANALLGMKVMYDLKFDKLFSTFSQLIQDKQL